MTEHQTEDNDVTTPEAELDAVETDAVESDAVETDTVEAEAPEAEAADAEATEAETAEADADEAEDAEVEGTPVVRHTLNAGAHHLAQTVGRRKQAIVRVRLLPGTGKFTLNGKSMDDYFPNKVHQQLIREPLVTTEKPETFDVIATLRGGGTTGQAGALRLAIARALIAVDSEDRPVLKKAGFLTRDPRVKERKKYGLKKARKAPQYSKR
ncbi:30S ribosomal protein S9 [Saccharothrix texasensis]|uniref:Small ribosomal subunit protein uS9 n=1 Tax=Saccharothrix texasensis TaxID=103734 RepID=A0A3N1HBN0_9PSEU|nr:30S ribosomal protein S9 [Saccharothrix texasensis]ROP39918.1 small subunit ribosomal protein S9 [Saccharothrix texasensis]